MQPWKHNVKNRLVSKNNFHKFPNNRQESYLQILDLEIAVFHVILDFIQKRRGQKAWSPQEYAQH